MKDIKEDEKDVPVEETKTIYINRVMRFEIDWFTVYLVLIMVYSVVRLGNARVTS